MTFNKYVKSIPLQGTITIFVTTYSPLKNCFEQESQYSRNAPYEAI